MRAGTWITTLVWLLTVAIRAMADEPVPGVNAWPLEVPKGGQPGFTLLSGNQTGILFTNQLLPWPEATNQNLLNGAGLALGDYDGDGWCDIFLCSLNGSSRLYRNLGGWRFQDVTESAGLANSNMLARGAVFADVNGDGALDLLVTCSGQGTRLFLNDGAGHFRDAQATELVDNTGSMSMALGDVNGDGSLDLYVANYGENTIRSGMKISTRIVGGKEQVTGRYRNRLKIIGGKLVEYGEPSVLFLNDGHGKFRRVSWTDGTFLDESGAPLAEVPWELSFTAAIRDINQDGNPDIYVCNDFQDPDHLWLGDGRGRFRAVARPALRSTPHFSMTADFADINHDGLDDIFVTDMISRSHELRMRQVKPDIPPIAHTREKVWDRPQVRRNFLFLNRGDGTYADIANYAGVACSDWSWSAAFLDVDLDGYPDILVGTGHYYDTQDQDAIERASRISQAERDDSRKTLSLYPPLVTPNFAFHNRANLTFGEVGKQWGFDSVQVSHSIALADLDNDGDLDVVVNCLRSPALVYRNNSSAPRVAVRLKGLPPNTRGIGARIKLLDGAVPAQSQEMTCGGRFLAGDAPQRTFAAGQGDGRMTLEVTWRSGRRSLVRHVRGNYLYEIDESAAVPAPPPPAPAKPAPLFEDVSAALGHRHLDPAYDDFDRQMLLPRRLSQLGPGVAWFDLNGDGKEDLVIGGGRGTRLGVYLNAGGGHWQQAGGLLTNALPDDAAGVVVGVLQPGTRSVLVGLAHYETRQTNLPAALRYDWTAGGAAIGSAIPAFGASSGPLALADVYGDGNLDLFVGGRLKAGRYPEPATCGIFRNQGGQLVADEAANGLLVGAGLVAGAVFSDLDGDGFPELLLACEWGPVRVFHNEHGRFREWDIPLSLPTAADPQAQEQPADVLKLSDLRGIWTCVATGDFDGDGRMDIVLGNWGLNSSYQQVAPGPWFLYYGDFNEDGEVHILEAFQDASLKQVVPWRDLTFMQKDLPWLQARFPTHKAYAEASLSTLLGDRMSKARSLRAEFLGSMVLLNRGSKFEVRLLPAEAQWSPVMGIAVGDLDGDGKEDLFLSQNYFAVRPEDGRLDAGRGLFLRGDGKGGFAAVPGQDSGILIYGEQRGCALADYDGDGRVDLVVTQNHDETRLFHNLRAQAGLRVKLAGPPGNPDGIGAVVRLEFKGRLGPAREVQAGSGFWSQNSPVQVLGTPELPTGVQVHWPGGKVTRSEVPALANSIVVDASGAVRAGK
ncbi:MAG: CRTAC1 family protein [Verrucomicrobiota bacterium]